MLVRKSTDIFIPHFRRLSQDICLLALVQFSWSARFGSANYFEEFALQFDLTSLFPVDTVNNSKFAMKEYIMSGPRYIVLGAIAVALIPQIAAPQWPLGRDEGIAAKAGETRDIIMVSGRYQVFVSPHAKGHTFMIDTDTGRVWVLKKDSASGDFSFHRVSVEQVDAEKKEKTSSKQ